MASAAQHSQALEGELERGFEGLSNVYDGQFAKVEERLRTIPDGDIFADQISALDTALRAHR
eukprot:952191-Pyramimonas_sp.AAC.1